MRIRISGWIGLALCALSVQLAAEPLTFGVVPQQSAQTLARLWTPIFTEISERSGYEIRFATAPDIPSFERRLMRGDYDIAYMNPYHYTVFHEKPGYEAIAKQADKRIKGILVVRRDSAIESLEDLRGLKLAFPSPAAFAATLLPRAELDQRGIELDPPAFVSSHDSVYMGVARGLFPAGGGIERTFNNTDPDVRDQLRILWSTRAYTPHAIAVHPRLDREVRARVRQALVELGRDAQGLALLRAISFSGIEAAEDHDWDDVRALDIRLLAPLLGD